MVISCPACAARYRLDPARSVGKRLSIRCAACQKIFVLPTAGDPATSAPAVLLATGDACLARSLMELCRNCQLPIVLCSDGTAAIRVLTEKLPAILLLDVALTGRYVFDVIRFVRSQPKGSEVKILLLTSSFRRGSFIAKTPDLHGADASFAGETLTAMAPEEFRRILTGTGIGEVISSGNTDGLGTEPSPVQWNQATNLAKVIAADIVLRYQDLLEESARTGVLGKSLVEGLGKARQLFFERMGEGFADNYDFVGAALAACLQGRSCDKGQDSDE